MTAAKCYSIYRTSLFHEFVCLQTSVTGDSLHKIVSNIIKNYV